MLIRLGVIFRENFMEDKLTVLYIVIFRETFTAPALSVGVIFRKFDFNLNLTFVFLLLSFLFTNLLTNMLYTAVGSAEDQCKIQKTKAIERKKYDAERSQTARSEQNYRHETELICSQEGNTESSRSPREITISLSSGCGEKLSWTQTRHR